jgi:hypothetical protein
MRNAGVLILAAAVKLGQIAAFLELVEKAEVDEFLGSGFRNLTLFSCAPAIRPKEFSKYFICPSTR